MYFEIDQMKMIRCVPGQALVLQFLDSDAGPGHACPPSDGGGLLQFRVLVSRPAPQLLVHLEYSPHVLHRPLTNRINKIQINKILGVF